ncbi:hypothetical protein CAEBREN_25145 [Caenorhabditis brenneri]|uniref:Uncharacterized protein n=1 Tax=Caenorhabditis brenneri TaxID=135651 RepID=G0MGT1_CAEBE|nr:hypothetical protein CAEBREN_25145 [Caenorhabditis brenneri]
MSSGSQLWRQCARWLRDLNVLTTDNTKQKSESILEFAAVFRDGVLLCRLANVLIPNSIDQASVRPSQSQISQDACETNINLFVEFCLSHLNFQRSDLFTSHDLFHMWRFHVVLKTLSEISKMDVSTRRGVAPFPETEQERQSTSSSQEFVDDEEIYQSLKQDIDMVNPDETIYKPITSADPEEPSEQLYDRIVKARKHSMNENDVQSNPQLKRTHSINELFNTEKNYVHQALFTIIKTFYEPMKGIISTEDYNTIFGNIEEINALHTALLADLEYPVQLALGKTEENISRPTSLSEAGTRPPKYIGEVFVKYRDMFLSYGKYCSNLSQSRKLSNELEMTNDRYVKTCRELTTQANCKFSMNDLLCVPFQRITKYPLLLKELIKQTDLASPERKSLSEAFDVMEDVCCYINEESRDTEGKNFIDSIAQRITDLQMPTSVKLHDYGRMNKDGDVKIAESTATQSGKAKQRFVFLFDKVIVVCKPVSKVQTKDKTGSPIKPNTYNYKNAYVMSELNIDQHVSIDTKTGGTITRRSQYVIQMHRDRTDSNEITNLTFYFKNEAERSKWLNALLLSKSNVSPIEYLRDTNHKVSFTSFRVDVKKPSVCSVCSKLMKGLRYQGYKCDMNNGDIVVATSNCTPTDLSYLQFAKGDRIEVITMQMHNRFTGCLVNNRNRTGLVHLDHVSQQSRTASMIGIGSPMESPAGPIVPRVIRNESTVLPKKVLSDGLSRNPSSNGPNSSRTSRASSTSTINGTDNPRDYVNMDITAFLWWMGDMERAKAESTLKGTPNGTFLVRHSRNRNQTAISLSYKNEVKHMIIERNKDGKVYLDEDYIFGSEVELVQYYRYNNLIEIFQALDTCLKIPYSQCKVFKAIHDYEAPTQNSEGKFLTFKTGDTVVLLDTVGEDRGWWKGQVGSKTGFFPLSYVKPYDPSAENSGPVTPTSSSS